MVWVRPGPALIELHEEKWVREGASVDYALQQVDEGHDQTADQEEGDKRPQMCPCHPDPIGQAALVPRVGGSAGGARERGSICGTVLGV